MLSEATLGKEMDLFANFGKTIIDTFTNPMESLKSLGKGITKFISNPFKSIKDARPLHQRIKRIYKRNK